MAEKLVVGQKLWYVPGDRHSPTQRPHEVTVASVGRKWATLTNRTRVDMGTMQVEYTGYGWHGQCWLSRAEWEAEEYRQRAWRLIREAIGYRDAPSDISTDAIRQAAALLGITLPEDGVSNG